MRVYQIWYETKVGPVFSSLSKAEEYLAKDEGDMWQLYRDKSGYPDIEAVEVDDTSFMRDR